jgi:hypothetical protein
VRHHGFSHSSLYKVTSKQAPRNLLIENTETHNSALRLTRKERYDVEDVVSDLERTHHIKTSMNELARLGLLSILRDYKQRKQQSLVYKVKKA